MDMASGRESITIVILASGTKVELMDMVFTLGQTATDMKVSGIYVSNKAMELIHLRQVIVTRGSIRMDNLKAEVNIPGRTASYTSENSRMASNMVKANGEATRMCNVAVMKGTMLMIREMDKELSPGLQATPTEVSMLTTKGMGLAP